MYKKAYLWFGRGGYAVLNLGGKYSINSPRQAARAS